VFLYRHVLDDPLPGIDDIVRARQWRKVPVVLTGEEVWAVLAAKKKSGVRSPLDGLMASEDDSPSQGDG